MDIVIKRAYEPVVKDDGYRVLVDRLWPRGIKKEALALDEWCKDVAPSAALRTWFAHDPAKFDEFAAAYTKELQASNVPIELLDRAAAHKRLTLIYATRDPVHNHATVLQHYLKHLAK
jgi:uncharacterized protein YeaO (DUF488 family)